MKHASTTRKNLFIQGGIKRTEEGAAFEAEPLRIGGCSSGCKLPSCCREGGMGSWPPVPLAVPISNPFSHLHKTAHSQNKPSSYIFHGMQLPRRAKSVINALWYNFCKDVIRSLCEFNPGVPISQGILTIPMDPNSILLSMAMERKSGKNFKVNKI